MANEANEKNEQAARPLERQSESEKRSQSDVNANVTDYTEKVIASRLEKKLSGSSGVTGQLSDKSGNGLASAKDLLGNDAHGLSKRDKQAALMAQIEKDGYIVGKPQDKPVLIAQNLDALKQLGMDAGELALEKAGVFAHRGNEDKYVDYKAAQEASKMAGLDKLGLSGNLVGAIMRNEQHYYKKSDAEQDKQVKEKGTVLKDGHEDLHASIGPAQMQIRNIKRLIDLRNADGKPEYPYLQQMKDDPLRAALDPKSASLLVAAYSKEVVKDLKAHGILNPTDQQVIYLYNDDVNSFGSGNHKTFVSVSAPGSAAAEKLIHADLRRERIPNDPRILQESVHVRHVMHALKQVNTKYPLLETPKSPGRKEDSPAKEKPHKTGSGTDNQEFVV